MLSNPVYQQNLVSPTSSFQSKFLAPKLSSPDPWTQWATAKAAFTKLARTSPVQGHKQYTLKERKLFKDIEQSLSLVDKPRPSSQQATTPSISNLTEGVVKSTYAQEGLSLPSLQTMQLAASVASQSAPTRSTKLSHLNARGDVDWLHQFEQDSAESSLFVFKALVSPLKQKGLERIAKCMYDSGASTNFMSRKFAAHFANSVWDNRS